MSPTIRKATRFFAVLAFAAVLALGHSSLASACPNCKEGVGSQANLARGFYYSILFMLGTPITIVTVYGVAFYRSVKKAQAEQSLNNADSASQENDSIHNDAPSA